MAILSIQICLAIVFLSFSNCTSSFEVNRAVKSNTILGKKDFSSNGVQALTAQPQLAGTTAAGNTCSLTGPDQLFTTTYYPVLRSKCLNCHVPDAPLLQGRGFFASPNLATAFDAFSLVGYRKISQYAVDNNHNSSITGGQANTAAINQATNGWLLGVRELAECQSNTPTEFVEDVWKTVRVYSKSKGINPTLSGESIVSWDLRFDILKIPTGVNWPYLPGAKFEITVKPTFNGARPSYSIFRPRIVYPQSNPAAVDIHLQSVRVKIDGVEVINETTFHYVDAKVYKNTDTTLSAGAMVAVGDLRKSDMISVSFGKVDVVSLPPPAAAPSVQFTTAATTGNEKTLGNVLLTLRLSEPVDDFVTVGYSIATPDVEGLPGAKPDCCLKITNDTGRAVDVKNFDRDFIKPANDGGTVVFEPNVMTKTILITVVDDDRFEKNEIIKVAIDGISIGTVNGVVGAIKVHDITIVNDDVAPAVGEITFTRLMSPGGAFERYCIRCHHAPFGLKEPFREYDMTTHGDLISSNRVVPRNAELSSMWWRIRGRDNLNKEVFPMPQGGLFDTDGLQAKDDIYEWIMSGAKNN